MPPDEGDDRENASGAEQFTLLGADGVPYRSDTPGVLGGNRRRHIYGRLDCPSALRALRKGGYVKHRVFFADESTAVAAGFRPCGSCLREKYRAWKQTETGRVPREGAAKPR